MNSAFGAGIFINFIVAVTIFVRGKSYCGVVE